MDERKEESGMDKLFRAFFLIAIVVFGGVAAAYFLRFAPGSSGWPPAAPRMEIAGELYRATRTHPIDPERSNATDRVRGAVTRILAHSAPAIAP
jgi:hypothetical protein